MYIVFEAKRKTISEPETIQGYSEKSKLSIWKPKFKRL